MALTRTEVWTPDSPNGEGRMIGTVIEGRRGDRYAIVPEKALAAWVPPDCLAEPGDLIEFSAFKNGRGQLRARRVRILKRRDSTA